MHNKTSSIQLFHIYFNDHDKHNKNIDLKVTKQLIRNETTRKIAEQSSIHYNDEKYLTDAVLFMRCGNKQCRFIEL